MTNHPVVIREVWFHNVSWEMQLIEEKLDTHSIIAFDTEFPGFLLNTPRDATKELRHHDLHQNVNSTKLIQLGLTLLDERGNVGGCWEVNFSDFDIKKDYHVRKSITLLERNGIDFERNSAQGVRSEDFSREFCEVLRKRKRPRWVAFHGQYDVAYLFRLLSREWVPESEPVFVEKLADALGVVYDVKYMAERSLGLKEGSLGLEKLSKNLMVERVGGAHRAGSDSLLTARVFVKLVRHHKLAVEEFEGYLFGISLRIERRTSPFSVRQQQQRYITDYYEFFDMMYSYKQPTPREEHELMRARYYSPTFVPYYNIHGLLSAPNV